MGQVLRREYGSKRAMLAALLTTGMLAALLALTGLATPAPAYADDLKGSGTSEDPVLIYSTDDLVAWCNKLNTMGVDQERQQYARLMEHLISDSPSGEKYGGAVTDDVINAMNHSDLQVAKFDGNHHLIELQLTGHGALFKTGGQPDGGSRTTIEDLHFIGSVSYGGSAGTLFESIGKRNDPSQDREVSILDCTNQASVSGGTSFTTIVMPDGGSGAGGFIGSFWDNEVGRIAFQRCSNFGEIVCKGGHAGGMAGRIVQLGDENRTGYVDHCTNNGTIKSMDGTFATVKQDDVFNEFGGSAGGLIGHLAFSSATGFEIDFDYNQGDIYSFHAAGYCGGLVGYVDAPEPDENWLSWDNSYNTGSIQPSPFYLYPPSMFGGGLFGHNESIEIDNYFDHSLTLEGSVPSGAVSDTWRNGEIVKRSKFEIDYLDNGDSVVDYIKITDEYNRPSAFPDAFSWPVLKNVGVAKKAKVTRINPVNGSTFEDSAYWNTLVTLPSLSSDLDGYRFAYWTLEPPDEGGFWNEPPEEYKHSDPDDPGQRVYGGSFTVYAYFEPSSTAATLTFDLNNPDEKVYNCTMDPENATKAIVKYEPVGALPTATCVSKTDKNDTRAFLGWATRADGSDPHAEWISEGSDNLGTTTLYAQWADTSVPFEFLTQPEDYTISALAGASHHVFFGITTMWNYSSAHSVWATLQYKSDSGEEYKDIAHRNTGQFFFDIESTKEAEGRYRIKIDYYDHNQLMGTTYSSYARIVLDIPQPEAEVSLISLSEPKLWDEDFNERDSDKNKALGSSSYDIDFKILGDPLPELMGETQGRTRHRIWIEGGPVNTDPGFEVTLTDELKGTLQYQHLVGGPNLYAVRCALDLQLFRRQRRKRTVPHPVRGALRGQHAGRDMGG